MALLDRERIRLLKTLSTSLADASLPEVNLVLAEAGLGTLREEEWVSDDWDHREVTDADRREVLLGRLRKLGLAELTQFAEVTGSIFNIEMESTPLEKPAEPLRIFASHRDGQKAHVHEVAAVLRLLHITLFVAHDDINPGEEWVDRIEKELRTTHAGVIFLVPGFETSTFCDQEVGWMRGRNIPLYTLKYQTALPYGFFGRRQAQHVPNEWRANEVATNLVKWLSLQSEIAGNFATSLALSLQSATTFEAANKRFGFIENRKDLTAAQTAAVAAAARDNNQITGAEYRPDGRSSGEGLAHRILRFLKDQPGFSENAGLISEVAEANDIDDLGLIIERDVDMPF